MIVLGTRSYTIFVRNRKEAEDAWEITRKLKSKLYGGASKPGGEFLCQLPATHGIVMAQLDPEWLHNDWTRLKRAVATGDFDVHILRPGEVMVGPRVDDGEQQHMTFGEFRELREAAEEENRQDGRHEFSSARKDAHG